MSTVTFGQGGAPTGQGSSIIAINEPAEDGDVSVDGTSIGGDGTRADPLHTIADGTAVAVDGTTIAGNGLTATSLHVVPAGLADKVAVLTDGTTIIGTGQTGSPLTVITGGGGGAIVADEVTLTGFGTVLVPVEIKAVQHDGTLTGNGTTSSELGVVAQSVAVAVDGVTINGNGTSGSHLQVRPAGLAGLVAVDTDGTLTGDGTSGSALGVVAGSVSSATDGVTLTGNGTTGTPIKILQVEHDTTITGAGTVASPLAQAGLPTVFSYTVTGSEPDLANLAISLPAARASSGYFVAVGLESDANLLISMVRNKSTTQFVLALSAPATVADVFTFSVSNAF